MFLLSMPPFNSVNFYQNNLKLSYFYQKNTKFLSAGGGASTTMTHPPLQIFGYAPDQKYAQQI